MNASLLLLLHNVVGPGGALDEGRDTAGGLYYNTLGPNEDIGDELKHTKAFLLVGLAHFIFGNGWAYLLEEDGAGAVEHVGHSK